MTVREATEGDAELLLAWRNDPGTRRWSRAGEVVALEDHMRWLEGVLASPDRLLFVAEEGGPVGTVRFDVVEGESVGTWEVSITVAPGSRGRGLAGRVLAAGERELRGLRSARRVLATVHEDNVASLALFGRAGYAVTPEPGPFRVLAKSLENA
ncbi:GNAT family N-acetyltransferase [Prauserella sp. ASG 168]|uniref:GNAT family N-acetyltransferase n=1 Tax=Prauserella cavernicola TaxID=2800127 RepID=A0A934QRI3_9PSEU|nr:GNAT family N-acetyltransferase [Prauserella cavernicola]